MLEIGIAGIVEAEVNDTNTADTIGSGNLKVFATPCMIALMEQAAAESVLAHLQEGESSVGISISVEHLKATPAGMTVSCESALVAIDGKRLDFEVSAFDNAGIIGRGEHSRYIIDIDKFMAKTMAKLEQK